MADNMDETPTVKGEAGETSQTMPLAESSQVPGMLYYLLPFGRVATEEVQKKKKKKKKT